MLYEEKLKALPPVDIGSVPERRRLEIPFVGDVSGPIIHGKVAGTDYVLLRTDGVESCMFIVLSPQTEPT